MQQNVPQWILSGPLLPGGGGLGQGPRTGYDSIAAHGGEGGMGHKGASCNWGVWDSVLSRRDSCLTCCPWGMMLGTHWSPLDLGLLIYSIIRTS